MDRIKKKAKKLEDLYLEEIKMAERYKKYDVSTGIGPLDTIFGGYRFGELVVIAARPAMGKTTFLLRSISRMSVKLPVLYFVYENERRRVINELIGIKKEPNDHFIRDHISELKDDLDLSKEQIFISDCSLENWHEYVLLILDHVLNDKVKVVVVETDYLTNFPFRSEESISFFKQIAQLLNVLIIVSTGVSKACEERGGMKKPELKDLEITRSIMDQIDTVLLLYRPEYYGILTDEYDNDTSNRLEIIIAKYKGEVYPCFAVNCLYPTLEEN